jgi:trehalose synthase-fused probable maltokinase
MRRILMTEVSKAFLQEHFNSSLLEYAISQRWYAHKAIKAKKLEILSAFPLNRSGTIVALVCEITLAGEEKASYFIPVEISETEGNDTIGSFVVNDKRITLKDAFLSSRYAESLLHNFLLGAKVFDGDSYISFSATDSFAVPQNQEFRVIKSEQSNSSFILGNSIIIKNYRNIKPGENPDIDVPKKLFAQTEFRETPAPMGDVTYYGRSGKIYLAYASRFIADSEDAWSLYNRLFSGLLRRSDADHSLEEKFLAEFIEAAGSLGSFTGRMHHALSSIGSSAFTPERVNENDITTVAGQIRKYLERAGVLIGERKDISTGLRLNFESVKWEAPLEYAEDYLLSKLRESHAQKIRVHGDYHLGQILMAGGSYYVIDFEGEPMKDISERVKKYPPEKDNAGMIRSLDYLLQSVYKSSGILGAEGLINAARVRAENVFIDAYKKMIKKGPTFSEENDCEMSINSGGKTKPAPTGSGDLTPDKPIEKGERLFKTTQMHEGGTSDPSGRRGCQRESVGLDGELLGSDPEFADMMLRIFVAEKSAYELVYELNNRPDWVEVPLHSISRIFGEFKVK